MVVFLILKLRFKKLKRRFFWEMIFNYLFIILNKAKITAKVFVRSIQTFYTRKFHTNKPQAIGGIFIHVEVVTKIANCFCKKISLRNKKIKCNKTLERVLVSIGLLSLFKLKCFQK